MLLHDFLQAFGKEGFGGRDRLWWSAEDDEGGTKLIPAGTVIAQSFARGVFSSSTEVTGRYGIV